MRDFGDRGYKILTDMKLILVLGILSFANIYSQSDNLQAPCEERYFSNQGEQEDCWAAEFFKKEPTESYYLRFDGEINVENQNTINFGNKYLTYWDSENSLEKIFTNGIFYPQMLIGYDKVLKLPPNDSLTLGEKLLAKLKDGSDTLKISNFEELKFLRTSPLIRKFRFWVYHSGTMNPQVYFIKLRNDKATTDTNIEDFIYGARLTFLKGAWIII